MIFRAAILASALLAASTAPQAKAAEGDLAEFRQSLLTLRAADQRIEALGWRLVSGNAAECAASGMAAPAIGTQLADAASYPDAARVRAAMGLTGDFMVQTIAPGSPADHARITLGSEVIAVGGKPLSDLPSSGSNDWQRMNAVRQIVADTLASEGEVVLTLADGSDVTIPAAQVCATRFEVGTGSDDALADGTRVIIGTKFPGLTYPDEDLAAALAHELAHNLLRHRAWLAEHGRKRRNIRLTEMEADRLAPWLLANAGYDPQAAVRFMRRWGPRHDGGLLRKRTHEGWDERAERIEAEIAAMEEFRGENGRADWTAHFVRDTDG